MKKSLIAFCVASAAAVTLAGLKIGTVDMLVLVKNHPAYDTNKTLLSNTEKDFRKNMDEIKKELESIQLEGKKYADTLKNPMAAAKAKAEAEKALESIQSRYMQQQQKLRSEMMRSQQELSSLEAGLLKAQAEDLKKRIAAFADKNGFDLVMDASAAIFSRKSYDVTNDVLKEMGVDPAKAKSKE